MNKFKLKKILKFAIPSAVLATGGYLSFNTDLFLFDNKNKEEEINKKQTFTPSSIRRASQGVRPVINQNFLKNLPQAKKDDSAEIEINYEFFDGWYIVKASKATINYNTCENKKFSIDGNDWKTDFEIYTTTETNVEGNKNNINLTKITDENGLKKITSDGLYVIETKTKKLGIGGSIDLLKGTCDFVNFTLLSVLNEKQ